MPRICCFFSDSCGPSCIFKPTLLLVIYCTPYLVVGQLLHSLFGLQKHSLGYHWWPPLNVVWCPSYAPISTSHNPHTHTCLMILPTGLHSYIKGIEPLHMHAIFEALCSAYSLGHDIVNDLLNVFSAPSSSASSLSFTVSLIMSKFSIAHIFCCSWFPSLASRPSLPTPRGKTSACVIPYMSHCPNY